MVLRYNGDPTSQLALFGGRVLQQLQYLRKRVSIRVRASSGRRRAVPPCARRSVRRSRRRNFRRWSCFRRARRVPVGGIVSPVNANLQPDHATEYDVGGEQLFGRLGHQLHVSADVYQTQPAGADQPAGVATRSGLSERPAPPHLLCPLSYPVNAGDGTYRGIDFAAEQQLGPRSGASRLDINSSFLTAVPENIQDGTLVIGEQTLGQPLHKAYFGVDRQVPQGLVYGAQVNYEGWYNELNRTPYATLDAHVTYRHGGYEFGVYGTNLTNVYATPFTVVGGGVLYGTVPGNPMITPNAFNLEGAKVVFVVTRSI